MGNFNNVDVNSASNIMTIGGSVRSSAASQALQIAGKEIRKFPTKISQINF
jgi:hypothetical protein